MRIKLDRKGVTMVEMIVSFALLGILMVAASYVISGGLSIYYRVKDTNYAQMVSDTVLDKIAGEVAGAEVGANAACTITISDGSKADGVTNPPAKGKMIAFYNRYGSPIVISAHLDDNIEDYMETSYTDDVEIGAAVIHYRPVNQGTIAEQKATNWTFDQSAYMNYRVTDLTFEQYQKGDKNTNVIIITLKIQNQKNGFEFEQTRYVECYNFRDSSDVAKISYGAVPLDTE